MTPNWSSSRTQALHAAQSLDKDWERYDMCRRGTSGYRKEWLKATFRVERISTKENGSDLLTNPLSCERTEYLMRILGTEFRGGRATSAKALVERHE